jgi:hypothetical protein
MTELQTDIAARAVRCAVWLALVESERIGWIDVRDDLYRLHATVETRLHGAEYEQWRRHLEHEGPHQGDPDA